MKLVKNFVFAVLLASVLAVNTSRRRTSSHRAMPVPPPTTTRYDCMTMNHSVIAIPTLNDVTS